MPTRTEVEETQLGQIAQSSSSDRSQASRVICNAQEQVAERSRSAAGRRFVRRGVSVPRSMAGIEPQAALDADWTTVSRRNKRPHASPSPSPSLGSSPAGPSFIGNGAGPVASTSRVGPPRESLSKEERARAKKRAKAERKLDVRWFDQA